MVEAEHDWVLDVITEYLQSPEWKTSIIDFIDENCVVFEDAEENRLEYTNIHKRFQALIEKKLEEFIQDLGVR